MTGGAASRAAPAGSAPVLALEGISKSFLGVHALKGVSLDVARGAVVGLIGQNGAGKSTLMNVIGGVLPPDAGTMRLDGLPYSPNAPADAADAGIAFIHQELNLFTNLSVADNLFIDRFPRRAGIWVDRAAMRRRAAELLRAVDLDVSPATLVERLAPGERQLVEIARALGTDARLIIFDEPTTSLTARETERLFALIERLRSEGRSILYISHTLEDVLRLADEIVVLRDGEVVDAGPAAEFTVPRMISRMVGREMEQVFPQRESAATGEVALEVRGLSQPGAVHEITFDLHRGEILGVFGLMGSGRTELARILFGLDPRASGEIRLHGEILARDAGPRSTMRSGLAFVTEDRRQEGLLMDAPVIENAGLTVLSRFTRSVSRFVDRRKLADAVRRVGEDLRLSAGSLDRQPVRSLSGGNQQKVVLGKWLLTDPEVLILDEPTRGIDVGAKQEVYGIIGDLAAQGKAVLMISSELEELTGMCDRILVMHNGEVRGVFSRPEFREEVILGAAFGGQPVQGSRWTGG